MELLFALGSWLLEKPHLCPGPSSLTLLQGSPSLDCGQRETGHYSEMQAPVAFTGSSWHPKRPVLASLVPLPSISQIRLPLTRHPACTRAFPFCYSADIRLTTVY